MEIFQDSKLIMNLNAVYPFDNEDTIYVDDEGLLIGLQMCYHWTVLTDKRIDKIIMAIRWKLV